MCFIQTSDLASARHEALAALLHIVRTSTSETQVRLAAAAILKTKPDPAEPATEVPTAPAVASISPTSVSAAKPAANSASDPRPTAFSAQPQPPRAIGPTRRFPAPSSPTAAAMLASAGCPPPTASPSPRCAA